MFSDMKKKSRGKTAKKSSKKTKLVPGGAAERKAKGLHIILVRVPIATVKRLDAAAKKHHGGNRTQLIREILENA